jgi:hypothetical protein
MTERLAYENDSYDVFVQPQEDVGNYCVRNKVYGIVELRTSLLFEAINMADELETQLRDSLTSDQGDPIPEDTNITLQ